MHFLNAYDRTIHQRDFYNIIIVFPASPSSDNKDAFVCILHRSQKHTKAYKHVCTTIRRKFCSLDIKRYGIYIYIFRYAFRCSVLSVFSIPSRRVVPSFALHRTFVSRVAHRFRARATKFMVLTLSVHINRCNGRYAAPRRLKCGGSCASTRPQCSVCARDLGSGASRVRT